MTRRQWTRPIQKCDDCGAAVMSAWLLGSAEYCLKCYQKRAEALHRCIEQEFPVQGEMFK